jgi:hypothetical protein
VGDSAFITLRNHLISEFNVTLRFSVLELANIRSSMKNVYLETGLINDVLHPYEDQVLATVRQPSGHICLASPKLIQLQN